MSNDHNNKSSCDRGKHARKIKIYTDEIKLRHTNHWDLDYMSAAEIEEAYETRDDPESHTPQL